MVVVYFTGERLGKPPDNCGNDVIDNTVLWGTQQMRSRFEREEIQGHSFTEVRINKHMPDCSLPQEDSSIL